MSAATRSLGPGPGAYMLPTLVGYDMHDARKTREPQYTFGVKKDLKGCLIGPGPGAYKLDKITRYGVGGSPAYSLGQRTFLKDRNFGPGPGAHNNHECPIFRGSRPPAYSIGMRTCLINKDQKPGPNAYMYDMTSVKPGIPSYSLGKRTDLKSKVGSPGPAAYGAISNCTTSKCSPAYSMTARKALFGIKTFVPGPNNYNLQEYKPGDAGPAFSFGVRHSPQSQPMVVECDN